MRQILPLFLLLAACSARDGVPEDQPANASALNAAGNVSAAPAEPAIDPKSPEAAVAVLADYFRLIEQKKYGEAHRLWSTSPQDTDLSDGAFAASFEKYRTYRAQFGPPGRIEGAAGSLYVAIPVTVTGALATGEPFRLEGPVTLRRVNDVPGATAEQLQWRITKADLEQTQVAAEHRFVGRWAIEERLCATRAWVFTASSLKTAAGSVCSFSNVTEVPGGYDIAASCAAEAPPTDDVLKLRFAESARALLFESRTIADAGLVGCR